MMAHPCPAPSCPGQVQSGRICCRACWPALPDQIKRDYIASALTKDPAWHARAAYALIQHLQRHG